MEPHARNLTRSPEEEVGVCFSLVLLLFGEILDYHSKKVELHHLQYYKYCPVRLVIICFCINFSGVQACSQTLPSSQPGFGLESVLSCAFFLNLSLLKHCQMPTLSFLSSQETEEKGQGSGF